MSAARETQATHPGPVPQSARVHHLSLADRKKNNYYGEKNSTCSAQHLSDALALWKAGSMHPLERRAVLERHMGYVAIRHASSGVCVTRRPTGPSSAQRTRTNRLERGSVVVLLPCLAPLLEGCCMHNTKRREKKLGKKCAMRILQTKKKAGRKLVLPSVMTKR